jgi:hypothetical protein
MASHCCSEPLLFKPAKADSQLSQIISMGADRQLTCPPEGVRGLPSKWRNYRIR